MQRVYLALWEALVIFQVTLHVYYQQVAQLDFFAIRIAQPLLVLLDSIVLKIPPLLVPICIAQLEVSVYLELLLMLLETVQQDTLVLKVLQTHTSIYAIQDIIAPQVVLPIKPTHVQLDIIVQQGVPQPT